MFVTHQKFLNKEFMSMHQTIRSVVPKDDERFLKMILAQSEEILLSPHTDVLACLPLQGVESPIRFEVEIVEAQHPKSDVTIMLSTEEKEPDERNHQKMVFRKAKFVFCVPQKGESKFGLKDVCYMRLVSNQGCTIRITGFPP